MAEMNLVMDLQDDRQQLVPAEVSIRLNTVEVRCNDKIAGIALREHLRAWLRDPHDTYAYDDLAWLWNGSQVLLHIDDVVPHHPLTHLEVAALRLYV